ncbi:MAG TPA: DUF4411 family protein [Defluviitoga tunisiensis]|nr:DUF4411 family protein [Defluviitoga tunisiensis]
MRKYIYIIDASSIIEMKDRYPANTFPSVWKNMEKLFKDGRLIAPDEVKEELLDDELKKWIRNKKKMFIKPDLEQIKMVKEILEKNPFLAKPEKPGGPNADPWIIAFAMVLKNKEKQSLFSSKEYIVVTEESKLKSNRIPAVAKNYGIESINLKELFQKEGWRF